MPVGRESDLSKLRFGEKQEPPLDVLACGEGDLGDGVSCS
jgi:hypothetical protein